MGFIFKTPKVSSAINNVTAAPAATPPPVVTETVAEDAARSYDQQRSNKRGLLSTILSSHNRGGALTPEPSGNSTLG